MKALPIASLAALALGLAACGPKTEQAADNAVADTGNAMTDMGNAASNAIDAAGAAITPTPSGQSFADTAARSDAFEIAAAKLALTKASSAKVKAFANDMIKAHTESTAKIKAASSAASPAIIPDATLTADQNDDLTELRGLTGAAFDKEYIDGQVDAHEEALSLMEGFAKDGAVPTLKTAAGEIAPKVKSHLDMAKALDTD